MARPVKRAEFSDVARATRGHVLLRLQSLEAQANILRLMSTSPVVDENIKPMLVFFAESIDSDCEYIRDCHWKEL